MNALVRDNLFSLVTLLLGVACAAAALQYSAESSGFPRAVAAFLIVLATVDLLRNARAGAKIDDRVAVRTETGSRQTLSAALLVFLSAPAFVILVKLFDFEIATFVYLVAAMTLLGVRNPLLVSGVSISVLIVVKGLFFQLLDVTRSSTLIFGS